MGIAPYIQRTLWNMDDNGAMETRERLISLSLAQREGDESIRLHDLQMDYLRSHYADKSALDLIHGVLRLSAHILEKDPTQFASQLVGRLLVHRHKPTVATFIDQVAQSAPRPWLRPLKPTLHPPGTALILTLIGHTDGVNCVAITPDGHCAVSGSDDETLRVWDLYSGRQLSQFEGHSTAVKSVAITPDGARVVSGSADGALKVWDLHSGRELLTIRGQFGSVRAVSVTRHGLSAVSTSEHTPQLWDLANGTQTATFTADPSLGSCAIAPDNLILTGDQLGHIHYLLLEE